MGYELFGALELDWRLVAESRAAKDALRRWADDPTLRGLRTFDDVLARTARGVDKSAANAVLGALIRRARTDPVAARVVLQALTPGLTNVARRLGAGFDSDVAADVVTAALERIRDYPYARRPHAIAANVTLDVLMTVRRSGDGGRDGGWRVRPVPPERLERVADEPAMSAHAGPDARDVLAAAKASGVDARQVGVVADAVLDRTSLAEAAARAGISRKAMKSRRDRARTKVLEACELSLSA
jgi:DNA-directed RNA polymerase specialized sigma24 family protein